MGIVQRIRDRRRRGERGAALVEFAILAPLLILLLIGLIEFGWLFAQYNQVRHGVREGARYAAVSNPVTAGSVDATLESVVCDAISLPNGTVTGTVTSPSVNNPPRKFDYAEITVTAAIPTLTGAPLIGGFIPATISNSAQFRLEQDAGWTNGLSISCP